MSKSSKRLEQQGRGSLEAQSEQRRAARDRIVAMAVGDLNQLDPDLTLVSIQDIEALGLSTVNADSWCKPFIRFAASAVNPIFYAADYGAHPDGRAADNTKALQKAIDAAAQMGAGTVQATPGPYAAPINVRAGVFLQGNGMNVIPTVELEPVEPTTELVVTHQELEVPALDLD